MSTIKYIALLIFLGIYSCNVSAYQELSLPEGDNVAGDVWIERLEIPWSLVFLPDGRAFVSERPGM